MKILVISNMYPSKEFPSYGVFVEHFCNQLEKENIDYQLCVMKKKKSKYSKLVQYFLFYLKSFFLICIKKYDYIYVHYASHSSLGVLEALRLKKNIKVIVNVHGSDVVPENIKQQKMQKYTRAILAKSIRIVVPSKYFKDLITDKYNVETNKIIVYPSGGVDPRLFYPMDIKKKDSSFQSENYNPEYITFGMVGRISFGKGWDVYVRAISECKKHKLKANFIIVGDGPEFVKMKQLIADLNLENDILLLGLQSQKSLRKIYNIIDYLVFPTMRKGESLGLVAIEAMACGTPVIASDFAAPKYYIQDNINGYKFPKGDYVSLAKIMKRVPVKQNNTLMCEQALKTAKEFAPIEIRNTFLKIFCIK